MNVILLEKVHKLGELGDQVRVKAGYGRNYLIPGGKAVPATPDNIARFERRRAELQQRQQQARASATVRAEKLNAMALTLPWPAGPEGKLFGSVGAPDIAEAVTAAGVELTRQEIRLPDGPLKSTGEYEIPARLHTEVSATIKVNVVPDSPVAGKAE